MKVLHLARNVRYITFTMRTNTKRTPCFLFLPPILSATRARGSHDLRPRVTRPAPAGHTTCARGSLTLCRSGTGNGPAKLGTSSTKRKSGSAERELGLAERHSRSEKPCAASSVALVQRNIVLPRNYSAIIALCLLVWDSHPADRLQSRIRGYECSRLSDSHEIVYLSVAMFLPYGRIEPNFLREVFSLEISQGSLVNWVNEAKKNAAPVIENFLW